MSVTRFPDRFPRTAAPASRSPDEHPDEAPTLVEFNWPPTTEEIDLIHVIDLGSKTPSSSVGFVAVLNRATPPTVTTLRSVPRRSMPPQWQRTAERKWTRLWPLAVGLLAFELVERSSAPRSDEAPFPPSATAIAHTAEPSIMYASDTSATPYASDRLLPRSEGASPVTRVEPRRNRSTSPVAPRSERVAPPAAAPRPAVRAANTPPADAGKPVASVDPIGDSSPPPVLTPATTRPVDSSGSSFIPPRVTTRGRTIPRPSPFPAARGSRARVEVMVDSLGYVESARLRSTTGASYFDERALAAVRSWRFEPARRGGRPVRAAIDVDVDSP